MRLVKIKWSDIQSWIKYNTWLNVICKDTEYEIIEWSDTDLFLKKYNENR